MSHAPALRDAARVAPPARSCCRGIVNLAARAHSRCNACCCCRRSAAQPMPAAGAASLCRRGAARHANCGTVRTAAPARRVAAPAQRITVPALRAVPITG